MEAASDSQISSLVDILKEVDPAFEMDKTQQKHLKNYPVLQKFLDTHSYRSHYMFCLKRCTSAECPVCSISIDTRVPSDLLEKLHYLPLPVPDEGDRIDHYKPFSELWGSTPTGKFRPSLGRHLDDDEIDKIPFTASGENCRGFVNCEVCKKPRCFFSKKKLTGEQNEEVRKQNEDVEFTCGAQLFYTDQRLVYMEIRITCESHVSSHYFHKRQAYP
ncbi:hypothetical protein FSP39_000400 [Pinctada imbricata]|uniref:Uncharacterized protein n=1 Tax=Pinctada imbricata TaxID=66713 RepID=A0AA88Y1V1_PINIB|nr:hypothetical protein FSP39_000400 [Pinctada imbricata]